MSIYERNRMKGLIKSRNEHNRLLNEVKPNAEYYYSIRNGHVTKIFKDQPLSNIIDSVEKRVQKIEKKFSWSVK